MNEFPTTGPITVVAKLAAGILDVTAEPRDSATVDITPIDSSNAAATAAEKTTVEMNGDRLTITGPERWISRRSSAIRVVVRVPTNSILRATTASTDTRTTGQLGDASIHTASGDANLDHVGGRLEINAASADVRVNRVDGPTTIRTASGDVWLGQTGDDVTAYSASGDIAVGQAGGSVDVTTASGDIRVDQASRGRVRGKSASGDVRVGVVAGTGTWLEVSTLSGRTTNELAMTGEPAQGTGATLSISVTTASGDIHLARVAAPTAGATAASGTAAS